jgi:hypothetical protein
MPVQAPVMHVPPQPSLPPQLAHSGAHSHIPFVQTDGALHTLIPPLPPQQGCPWAPQLLHEPSQVAPARQISHVLPATPQAETSVPGSHVSPRQQPFGHELASQAHEPAVHTCPAPHVPVMHVPPQPSGAPQATPPQLGMQPPPHVFATPEPPQVDPSGQPGQSMTTPHGAVICPHLPLQMEASTGQGAGLCASPPPSLP